MDKKLLIIGPMRHVSGGAIQFACLKSKTNKCKNNKFKHKENDK